MIDDLLALGDYIPDWACMSFAVAVTGGAFWLMPNGATGCALAWALGFLAISVRYPVGAD